MGLFDKFKERLKKTHDNLVHGLKRIVTISPKFTEEMEEELDIVKDQLLDAEIKLEQMKQELESSVDVTTSSSSASSDDDHSALIEQNKKLRTALSTLHAQSTQYKQESAKRIRALEKDTSSMSSFKDKIGLLEERAKELEESNAELKDAVDTGAA